RIVRARVARIAEGITVRISLGWVRHGWAVVGAVVYPIAVGVAAIGEAGTLVAVEHQRIGGITEAVIVCVAAIGTAVLLEVPNELGERRQRREEKCDIDLVGVRAEPCGASSDDTRGRVWKQRERRRGVWTKPDVGGQGEGAARTRKARATGRVV